MSNVRSLCHVVCAVLPLLSFTAASATDEQKIIRLEQDVRKLERIVQDQARQIEDLRRQLGNPSAPSLPNDTRHNAEPSTKWLDAASWERIRRGMSELEVLRVLGPPTQTRPGDAGGYVLLYAMAIGNSGFLAGNVTIEDRKVVDVEPPTLR